MTQVSSGTNVEKKAEVKVKNDGKTNKESQNVKKVSNGKESNQTTKTADNATSASIKNCYCGKDRDLNSVELLCANCNFWFHEGCLSTQLGRLLPFMTNYIFFCKNCSMNGIESFKKNQAQFSQMCMTAIANLQQMHAKKGSNRLSFCKDKEIIPFIENYWENLTTTHRRVTQSWHSTIQKAFVKDVNILFTFNETIDGQYYGLINHDLHSIKPNYEGMIRGGSLKITESGVQPSNVASYKGRSAKRKIASDTTVGRRGRNYEAASTKLSPHGYPIEHPFNKDGYRYLLAETDMHAPFRQEFDDSLDWAGKPIPGWLYRVMCPNAVLLALHDRAPQLKVNDNRLIVTGDKGYSMIRATHSVARGTWYWEAKIDEMPENSATRIGWCQDYANLQAPVGYDKFGYCWRSRKGTCFHESIGKHFSNGYSEGDVLGFLIILPEHNSVPRVPKTFKDRPLVKFKSHFYYEEKDDLPKILKALKPLQGSKIIFYRNGVCEGVAFTNIYCGSYYPAISLYKNTTVSVNFGPEFKHPPSNIDYSPVSQRAHDAIYERILSDLSFFTQYDGKLRLDSYNI